MAGLAIIAKQKGLRVTGSDKNITGPLAQMLSNFEIELTQGYEADTLPPDVDYVVIGNALSRGVPVVERILNENIRYYSGPQWLYEAVLRDRWVIAVSGTHGKTTTTSMVTWILEQAGFNPGFLVGGNPCNFDASARYTDSNFFVIEADEYDTAFFDKRSKFIHYNARTLIINNLEFDHADIFPELDDIKRQFHHLLRIVPSNGLIIAPSMDVNVQSVLSQGVWTPQESFGAAQDNWFAKTTKADNSEFEVFLNQQSIGQLHWNLIGEHNKQNALAAIGAVRHVGIKPEQAIAILSQFSGVKRRLELRGKPRDIAIYDDFAHHPTAIATTLAGLRQRVGTQRIFAVVEFASNTMKAGHHEETISHAFKDADNVLLLQPESGWQLSQLQSQFQQPVTIHSNVDSIIEEIVTNCVAGDHVVCMSNHHFGDIQNKLVDRLNKR